MRLTIKAVNKHLEQLGISERLEKGNGYFYFTEGCSSNWYSTSVMVNSVNQLSIEQWMHEYNSLKSSRYE